MFFSNTYSHNYSSIIIIIQDYQISGHAQILKGRGRLTLRLLSSGAYYSLQGFTQVIYQQSLCVSRDLLKDCQRETCAFFLKLLFCIFPQPIICLTKMTVALVFEYCSVGLIDYISTRYLSLCNNQHLIVIINLSFSESFNSFRHYAFLNLLVNFNRILASDTHGAINVWDRRVNTLPCLELASASCGTLNSIQLNADNQVRNCVSSLQSNFVLL